jgi:hypothetical protein
VQYQNHERGDLMVIFDYFKFRGSKYQQSSGNTFLKTLFDKGKYGEFLTYSQLEKLTGRYRLMTNLYLPKKDGSTTEIDLLMLSETGLYVFESKNYSGWIFGDEKTKNWMQILPNKQKEPFYNPIWQNKTHITALKSALAIENDKLFKSYIIFSERCTLKKINVSSSNVKVIKRNDLLPTIKRDFNNNEKVLTQIDVDFMFTKLNKFAHVDAAVKEEHIKQVHIKRRE